ncbi:MAG: Hint domain-containing protein [Rhodobacteraceae bacterium]|nr:Hint domain-containing protein [Paracoccaceae bacterium]
MGDDMSETMIKWFTAAACFQAGPGYQTTSSALGDILLGFKASGADGDLELVPGEDPDPTTQVTLDGGATWQDFTLVSSGEVTGTPSIFTAEGIPGWDPDQPLLATVILVDGEQFIFFPDYPEASGLLPGLITIRDDGQPIFVCFVSGTMIMTPAGEVPVESLKAGDKVLTRDHGSQPLRWIGKATVPAQGAMVPVCIRAGAFGPGHPTRDLRVSQQHRLLVKGAALELFLGLDEALVPAKHLVNGDTVVFDPSAETVTNHHLMFDAHEIVISEGMPTESFHPGEYGLDALEKQTRDEILALFPDLAGESDRFAAPALPSLRKHEAALLGSD